MAPTSTLASSAGWPPGPATISTSPPPTPPDSTRSRSGSTSSRRRPSAAAPSPPSPNSRRRSAASPTTTTPVPGPSCGPPLPTPSSTRSRDYLWLFPGHNTSLNCPKTDRRILGPDPKNPAVLSDRSAVCSNAGSAARLSATDEGHRPRGSSSFHSLPSRTAVCGWSMSRDGTRDLSPHCLGNW